MANKQQSRTKTSTSSFGSAGRISHDASTFYGSQLYDKLPEEDVFREFAETFGGGKSS